MPERNSVDDLNRQYAREAKEAAKQPPEPNEVDELNRKYQKGDDTAAAQTEAQEVSVSPEGGLEDGKK